MSLVDSNLSSKVEIFLGARNLPRLDYFSKSDPKILLYLKDFRSPHETLIGSTETVKNSHNPDFTTSFVIEYFFEENQKLLARVFDSDDDNDVYKVGTKNYIGEAEFTLGEVVGSPTPVEEDIISFKGDKIKNFTGVQFSTVSARCEEVMGVNEAVTLTISGRDLDRRAGCFGSTNAFLEIYKQRVDLKDQYQKVYTSEVVKGSQNPRFLKFSLRMHTLCNNDPKRVLLFKLMDQRKFSSPELIGQGRTTFSGIKTMVANHNSALKKLAKSDRKLNLKGELLPLVHPLLRESVGPKYKNSGVLIFHSADIRQEPSFLDFIQGGLVLKLVIAIDFTASNGNPKEPTSLHYIDPTGRTMNKYEKAIEMIGNVIISYDSDGFVPVWGFGGKLKGEKVKHNFSLTFDDEVEEVQGVSGILQAYRAAVEKVELSGPTMFGDIIQAATKGASLPFTQSTQHYSIMLILTDGVVNDMVTTIRRIVRAASKPLSIVIIGIGDADFTDMEILDGDSIRLSTQRAKAERDIVQFVPMNKFRASDMSRLAAEVLAEIPNQVLSFMRMRGFEPLQQKKKAGILAPPDEAMQRSGMGGKRTLAGAISNAARTTTLPGTVNPVAGAAAKYQAQ